MHTHTSEDRQRYDDWEGIGWCGSRKFPSRGDADSLSFFLGFSLDERFACLHFHKRRSTVAYFTIHCGFMYYILFSVMIQTATFFPFCEFHLLSCDSRQHFDSPPFWSTPRTASCQLLRRESGFGPMGAHRSDTDSLYFGVPDTSSSIARDLWSWFNDFFPVLFFSK